MLAESVHLGRRRRQPGAAAARRQARPARRDAAAPFGFGRERYIYSFIVAIVLFSVGGLFALYEAYHKYHSIHAGEPNEPARGPLVVGAVVLTGAIVRAVVLVPHRDRRGEQGPWHRDGPSFIRRAKSPEPR